MWKTRCSGFVVYAAALPAVACTVSADPMAFMPINPLDAASTDSFSRIDVYCPDPTEYSISLSAGNGDFADRTLTGTSGNLAYNIYADASRSTIWGDGSGSTVTVSGTADAAGVSHTAYGRIPAQPTAIPGMYADTLVVTVTY
ncbi:Csu type fimbrial protein [Tahibacter amnicola]|uniref:Spore coat protein U domain-containing protein n=1 Tax=Tahibacter amnicola TaxID=2976241 RepID=A0ABY6BDX7_9GAMM|nr:spore coat U domain-containing protein [Tahibacter amnicola]UXI67310.1 spore coat protein U domain-containing protein [Tahibacter amnicola]